MSRFSSGLGGCLHRGSALIVVLAAIGGVSLCVWFSMQGIQMVWFLDPETAEIRARILRHPEFFVRLVERAWTARIGYADMIWHFSTGCWRAPLLILGVASVGAIVAPKGVPHREAWKDVALIVLIVIVFAAISSVMHEARPGLVRKASAAIDAAKGLRGARLQAALGAAMNGTRIMIQALLGVGALGVSLFGFLAYRAVRRLFARSSTPPEAAVEVFS